MIAVFLFLPFSYFYYLKKKKQDLIEEKKWQLNLAFKEGMISISGALNAGYSIENSFSLAVDDLQLVYEEQNPIINEFRFIVYQLSMNKTVEEVLKDFATRSGVEDIRSFYEVFSTAKRTGGDVIRIIKSSCKTISDKIEVKREIRTLITAKRLESKIMSLIPIAIIFYLWIFSPGFLDPMYHNLFGVIAMSIALLVYGIAYQMMQKIVSIEV